jgi:RecT family
MDIAVIETKIDKVVAGATEVSFSIGGVGFKTMDQIFEMAKLMAVAGTGVPKHLRGNPGACLGVTLQALEWKMSPFAVANKSYEVNDRIAYEAQLLIGVINRRAPLAQRLRYVYEGEGLEMTCTVSGLFEGEKTPHEYKSPQIKNIKVRNSPLWISDPEQQLAYYSGRAWARRHTPETILGIYSPEEMEEVEADAVVPNIGTKLRSIQKQSGGFEPAKITQQMSEVVPETIVKPKETVAVAVVVERKEGEANSSVSRDDKTLTVEGGDVAGTAERGPDAQPKAEDKPVEVESPLQRGLRILSGLSKITDIVDLRATIAEELGREEATGWHRACDGRAAELGREEARSEQRALGTKEKESPK